MTIIETELGNALNPAVKRKANNTRDLRSEAKRVTGKASEVMVKITGFGKGAGHVKAHLDYISRNGKLELENDRGEIFNGKEEVKDLFKDWEKDFGDGKRRKNQRDTMHMVLSMPEGTDPESVRNATRAFTKATFGKNHEYVFALHTDEPHPHCHVTVKCLGFDGKRLNPRKDDLQQWREDFAQTLRDQGVDAEATPRRSRGVVKKAEPSVIRHIERGDETHPPRVSKVRASQIKEAAQELVAESRGVPVVAKPWEEAIKDRQKEIRSAWLAAAAALENEPINITFNNKEVRNERPNYDRSSARRERAVQRAAALYQSNLEKSGRQASPRTVASVRNLSGLGLVHNERAAKVLLQANAPDRLGKERAADPQVRWPGASAPSAHSSRGVIREYQRTADENKTLAARIRGFVDAMPGIETERDRLKRQLAQQFTKPIEQKKITGLQPDRAQQASVNPSPQRPAHKDIER